MSLESFLARRKGYLNSLDKVVAPDNGELDQRQVEENEVDSPIDRASQLDNEKVNDAKIIGKL